MMRTGPQYELEHQGHEEHKQPCQNLNSQSSGH